MSTGAEAPSRGAIHPAFIELAYLLDDEEAPTELTIYPPRAEDITTCWLSADLDAVIPLDEAR